jgi:NAD(P)-dependent dehydrogenase (short-subunit alcohol dehydrogenase family)
MKANPVALVVGAGEGIGSAIALRFADGEFDLAVCRRNGEKLAPLHAQIEARGRRCLAQSVDARDEQQMAGFVERCTSELGAPSLVVFNIGANVRFPIGDTTTRVFTKVWEMACLAGFLAGREAARAMVPLGRGTIVFTGATASLRGSAGFAAFASAKHGLRAVAQSMARELGPLGIHVAHVVVDGAVDTEFIRQQWPARYELKDRQGIVAPSSVAESVWTLHHQSRDAWTHELDLRPWMESF